MSYSPGPPELVPRPHLRCALYLQGCCGVSQRSTQLHPARSDHGPTMGATKRQRPDVHPSDGNTMLADCPLKTTGLWCLSSLTRANPAVQMLGL